MMRHSLDIGVQEVPKDDSLDSVYEKLHPYFTVGKTQCLLGIETTGKLPAAFVEVCKDTFPVLKAHELIPSGLGLHNDAIAIFEALETAFEMLQEKRNELTFFLFRPLRGIVRMFKL